MAGLQHTEGEERVALTHTLSRLFLQCSMRGERKVAEGGAPPRMV